MKTLFNGKEYAIYHMEEDDEDCEQYKIFIKEACRPQQKYTAAYIDRDCYANIEQGLEYAHQMARDTIREYFTSEPISPNQFKRKMYSKKLR